MLKSNKRMFIALFLWEKQTISRKSKILHHI